MSMSAPPATAATDPPTLEAVGPVARAGARPYDALVNRATTVAAALAVVSLLASTPAGADALSPVETDQLVRGATVTRRQTISRGDERYVGGIAYAIVNAKTSELSELLDDVGAWRRLLPHTRRARQVGAAGRDAIVELTHGTSLMQVTYSLRVRREADIVRFWLDRSRPHDIEDAWGFLRAEPLDGARTLVTYGILIDLGGGILRSLFEERVRELALTVPDRARTLLLERRTAARASAFGSVSGDLY